MIEYFVFKIFFPSEKSVYGTSNAYLTLDDKFNATHGGVIYYALEVDRVNWKSLDQAPRRCSVDNDEKGTTECITEFVERGDTFTKFALVGGGQTIVAIGCVNGTVAREGGPKSHKLADVL